MGKAGKAAVNLAEHYFFFGRGTLAINTAGSLEKGKMRRIKEIVLAKYGAKSSAVDQDLLWDKCKKAIGQKCNHLRISEKKGH